MGNSNGDPQELDQAAPEGTAETQQPDVENGHPNVGNGRPGADEGAPPVDGAQPDAEPDRQAMPVDDEEPPRLPFPVVGVGASAGGLQAFGAFLKVMSPTSGMAFVLILHLPPDHHSLVAEVLSRHTEMQVVEAGDGMSVKPNHVYVIAPAHVLTIKEGFLRLGPRLDSPRAANRPVDDFFKSLAQEQRERAIVILMSGMGSNGTAGSQAIKAVGGLCIAQDPDSAQFPSMPRHLIDAGYADFIAKPEEIPELLQQYARQPYANGTREADAETILQREKQYFREVLAVLRTRLKHDFSGYKKPTVLRRIQRRMSLARLANLGEYAKFLRLTPTEVVALGDDLLIHVTGFFRDPEAWEILRERVIVPLVAGRENESSIRCWVTACSSGEEAYTLAMLLVEECERTSKHLELKVFATDMAERSLIHARNGIYPGGIEADITPARLVRFFEKDEAMYRVRQDLRERVVFAPQNVLQDPPFSRLDIATCRNLLIYLEPDVQQRVLALLHFGLREGGILFLGSSEALAGSEELFEPLDKKARIFRRAGPTRHGMVEFPLPNRLRVAGPPSPDTANEANPTSNRRPGFRASFAQLTHQTLLEHHLPATVLVDRDYRILYYQGNTYPFLMQPSGEPTRDVVALTREGVRHSVRMALRRVAAKGTTTTATDGWVELEPGRRPRVHVTVSPVADKSSGDFYVISFVLRDNPIAEGVVPSDVPKEDIASDMRRIRDELQSTVEELRSSNEELKASHEEVVSINEEMQSSNEELETSKEEMQSLNEELSTVNAQLRAKMEEHQAASNDLSSLLTSTDIAVLFLDTRFRIRRFTPPTRELLDLISSDIGRPLEDMNRKFDDPTLLSDAETVLAQLVPAEREVMTEAGQWFLRRVTPYRTADNRIDGVVITFVNITPRRRAEEALRASEEQFRRAIQDAPIPVIMQAEDGEVLQINRTWTSLTGYELADVRTSDTWLSRAYGTGADAVREHMHELFKGTLKTLDVEFAIRTRNGTNRYWSFSASAPGTLHDGRKYLVGMAVDITDRKQAEEQQAFLLKLSDALRSLAEPTAIEIEATRVLGEHLQCDRALYAEVEPDQDHILIHRHYNSPGSASIAGRRKLSVFGRHWLEGYRAGRTLVTSDFRDIRGSQSDAFKAIGARACVGVPVNKEGKLVGLMIVHSKTPREWTPLQVALVQETAERTWAAVERARAEAAGQEGQERLRLALFAARMGTWAWDVAGNRHMRDENLNRLLGLEPVKTILPLEEFYKHIHPEDVTALRAAFAISALEGKPLHAEFRALWPDGTVRWLQDQGEVFARTDGPYLVGACVDVTERRTAEAALRESEERFRLAVEAAHMGFWDWDVLANRVKWEPVHNRLLGLPEDQSYGTPDEFFARIHPDDRADVERRLEAAVREGSDFKAEFRAVHPNGEARWVAGYGRGTRDASGKTVRIIGGVLDITDRKLTEQAIRDSEERLRLVVEGARDFAMLLLDSTGRITAWNPGAERLLGFTESEAVGQNSSIIFTLEDRAADAPEKERAQASAAERAVDERWHVRKGQDRFWGSGVMTALRNLDGSVRGFVKVLRDETPRKHAEEAEKAALQAAELANRTKDEFLATLSHELRTPLSAILLWAKMLNSQSDAESLDQGLAAIRNSADAQKQLIEDLLDTSRITSGNLRLEMRRTQLTSVVESAVESVLPTAQAKGVNIVTDFASKIGTVRLDPNRMKQVLWNLLTNAIKFTPRAGNVAISISRRDHHVEMRVTDSGKGIEPDFLPYVFEPFRQADSSTTRVHGGLGLGLAICKKLVEQHGGTITASSEGLGHGSAFTVTLPLAPVKIRTPQKAEVSVDPSGQTNLQDLEVLLVEDDLETRLALANVLRQSGAKVTFADSVDAALDAFNASTPDLLISDIGIPGEDGYSLMRRIRSAERESGTSQVPAIALTAFVNPSDKQESLTAGFNRHMGKPVEPEQLLNAIRLLLGSEKD